MQNQVKQKIRLSEAVSIGIGGMVGGGIFAVLGLAVHMAKGGTPIAFLIAGCIALLTSYSYAKLSVAYPSSGGTVTFINRAFGKNTFSGGTNNLLWVSYIIMLALYASAFGSYAPNLLSITGHMPIDKHLYMTLIILLATVINYYSVKVMSAIEKFAVLIKLIILLLFIGVGIVGLASSAHLNQLSVTNWPSAIQMISGGMVIFVAYEGFELIANVSANIRQPKKNIPRAYYISVGFVIVLYVIIAVITVGSLAFGAIADAQDYVLAQAAKPLLGDGGFTLITIAALISTFSAINASIYGGSRVNYEIAVDDELPHEFTKFLWNHPIGLLITSVFTMIVANTLNLESISTSGSAGFLLIFTIVNLAAYKKADEIGCRKWITILSASMCFIAFWVLAYQQFETNFIGIMIAFGIICISYLVEWIFKNKTRIK